MTTIQAFTAAQIKTARIRTSIGFILYGLMQGLWLVQIPVVVKRLDLDTQTFSLVVLAAGIGSAIAQPFAGWLVGIVGSRRATLFTQPIFFIMIPVLIYAPSIAFIFGASFLMGALGGPLNVSINTQATEIENARSVPTMSAFHGWFSVGSVASASIVWLIYWLGLGDGSGIIFVTLLAMGISVWLCFGMLPKTQTVAPKTTKKRFTMPTGALIGIAALIFFSNMVEGGTANFTSLFLSQVKGADLAIAGAGFTFYNIAMGAMRFAGGSLVQRLGEKRILSIGGVMIVIGFAIAIFSTGIWFSAFGFLIVGLGAANFYPVLMGSASRVPNVSPSVAVASIATAGLFGYLIGSPIVGFVAQYFGLSAGLGVLGLAGVAIFIGANLHKWPHK